MGNGFELRIGMTTQQVMSNINNMNATDKTKQLIINFCNNDHDKKITDSVELAMLDSWSKGSEKVKMPTAEGMTEVTSRNLQENVKEYRKGNNYLQITNDSDGVYLATYLANGNVTNVLGDTNKDGFADYRLLNIHKDINTNHERLTTYCDNNIDGVFENKNIGETIYSNDTTIETQKNINLFTNEKMTDFKTITKETYDKQGNHHGQIRTEINNLTGETIKTYHNFVTGDELFIE